MKRVFVLGSVLVIGALSIAAAAYQAPAQAPHAIDLVKLNDKLYVLTSSTPGDAATFSGGNVSVFITANGVTLVDTKLAGWGQAMLDKIKTVTSKPITTIINTHAHADHTGNNNFFGTQVTFVAQENTKANMEKMAQFKDDNAKFLPSETYKTVMTLGTGNDEIELHYFGNGHTSGDSWVYFPSVHVLASGDMFAWRDAPLCDRANGGSCVDFPKTLAKAIAAFKDRNVADVIPGHSPIAKLKDVETYQRYNTDLVAEALAAKKAGKSVDEATAAAGSLTKKYAGYQAARVKAAIQVIYDETK